MYQRVKTRAGEKGFPAVSAGNFAAGAGGWRAGGPGRSWGLHSGEPAAIDEAIEWFVNAIAL